MRYKLNLSYDGTYFHGWQIQPDKITVQSVINEAVGKVFSEDIKTYGCSRTDAGVHALEFICHFDTDTFISPDRIPFALNTYLPDEVRVNSCEAVNEDFHARFSVKSKTYKYFIYSAKIKNPFYNNKMLFINYMPDCKKLDEIAKGFIGKHDFSSFMAKGSPCNDTVREIYDFSVTEKNGVFTFSVCGNGFLYNSVRIMCGTILDIERGKINLSVRQIFESKERNNSGKTLPPDGLYLCNVEY